MQKILTHKAKDLERKRLIANLRKRGNHVKNVDKCVKPVKKSHITSDHSRCVPCKYCYGYYQPRQLWRHVKICPRNMRKSTTTFSHLTDSQDLLVKQLPIDSQLRETVFPKMLADKVSLVAKKDLLICKFEARYLKCHREKHLINVCSRKMRELAKMLIQVSNSLNVLK